MTPRSGKAFVLQTCAHTVLFFVPVEEDVESLPIAAHTLSETDPTPFVPSTDSTMTELPLAKTLATGSPAGSAEFNRLRV